MKRLLTIFAVLLGLLAPAALSFAITPQQSVVLFSGDGRLQGSALDFNFTTGKYAGCNLACLSITRASTGTNLLPTSAVGFSYTTFPTGTLRITPGSGLLIEEARTNQLLNSTVPATQTTGSLGTGAYTLWVNGTGSATMSAGTGTGCGTGAATNGTVVNFTITIAGTCTVTVAGSLNAFQLEAGSFGTSLITTVGSTATRAADVISLIGPAASIALMSKSAFFQTNGVAGGTAPRLWDGTATGTTNAYFNTATAVNAQAAANIASATIGGSGVQSGTVKAALGFDSTSFSVVANNGTTATNANAYVPAGIQYLGNRSAGDRALNGYMQRFVLWLLRLANGQLKAFTVP